jgi:NAD(P)-dependent dehydrogenase (short-subunit alcohol dehydrogenase family)
MNMSKIVLLTGATDGIGLETAKMLVAEGHKVLLHGRSEEKLQRLESVLKDVSANADIISCACDLSRMKDTDAFADKLVAEHKKIDIVINNAGILKTANTTTDEGLDVRFAVNTFAPYILAKKLLPILSKDGRIVNLSSAAQAPVDINALKSKQPMEDYDAYAQSKLAITMWTRSLAIENPDKIVVAVNPKSLLGSKMVKEAFNVAGGDLTLGADIIMRAGFSDEFSDANGKYFDNDLERFTPPHPDGLDDEKCAKLIEVMEAVLKQLI